MIDIANGSELNEVDTDTFTSTFHSKLTFRQLYTFLGKQKEYTWNKHIPHESCACDVCENTRLFIQGINKKLTTEKKLPTDVKLLVKLFYCPEDKRTDVCKRGDCSRCPEVKFNTFFVDSSNSSEERRSDSGEDAKNEITYFKWTTVNSKMQKIPIEIDVLEVEPVLRGTIQVLKYHLYVKDQQYARYQELKLNLGPGEILIHMDFGESYANKQQDEVQSAYFGHENVSIFTACCYVRDGNELIKHCIAIVSEESDHSRIATHSCILKVIDEIKKLNHNFPPRIKIQLWSDGCASQFRSRFVFKLTTLFLDNYSVMRYFNERHHGKGPMDGIGGTIKNLTFRAVQSGKIVIQSPRQFAIEADKIVKGISVLFMYADEVIVEPEDIC